MQEFSPELTRFAFISQGGAVEDAVEPVVDSTETAVVAAGLLAAAAITYVLAKHALLPALRTIPDDPAGRWSAIVWDDSLARRASLLVSIIVIAAGRQAIPHLSANVQEWVGEAIGVLFVVTLAGVITAVLRAAREVVPDGSTAEVQPVRAQLQTANLVVFVVAGAFIATIVTDQSLWYLLTGLGALAALLAVVFQHTILSTVAAMQITRSDLIRVGDWIEVPERSANGIVTDIALHTVKVRNWDNTNVIVPTQALLSESFQNWRSMLEAGIRRMQRSVLVDTGSVSFLPEHELERLRQFEPLDAFIDDYRRRWQAHDTREDDLSRAQRRITNLALFREYLQAFLEKHGGFVANEEMIVVRHLEPTPQGVPVELYAFAKTTQWLEFERLQAEVLEHVLAIAGEFGLRIYQQPTDRALRDLGLPNWPNGTAGPAREQTPPSVEG